MKRPSNFDQPPSPITHQNRHDHHLDFFIMQMVVITHHGDHACRIAPFQGAEQLLLAPTPYIIGLPSSFLRKRPNTWEFTITTQSTLLSIVVTIFIDMCSFTNETKLKFSRVPDDVWIVDLDSAQVGFQSHSTQILLLNICHNKWKMILSSGKHFRCCTLIWKHCRLWWKRGKCGSFALDAILSDDHFQLTPPSDPRQGFSIPPLPEPEGNTLRAHLKQVESRTNIFFLQFRGYLFILFLRLRDHISSWVQVCKLDKDGKVQNRIFKIGKSKLLFYVLKLSTL